jgi:hypothetical protein
LGKQRALAKKANPLLGQGLAIRHRKRIRKGLKPTFQNPKFQDKKLEYVGRSRVDWIYNEIWMKGK